MAEIEKMKQVLDEPYTFCELVLKSSELKFATLIVDEKKQKLDIIIYLKDFTIYFDNTILPEAVLMIPYNLLGAISMVEDLNFVQLIRVLHRVFPF